MVANARYMSRNPRSFSTDCPLLFCHIQPGDPKNFDINNPKHRVDFYQTLMGAFRKMPSKNTLIDALSGKPGF